MKWWEYPRDVILAAWRGLVALVTGKPWGGDENR